MKRLILIIAVFMLLATPAYAVDWINNPAPTLAWDAVTQDADGDPITDVTYQLVLAGFDNGKLIYEVAAETTALTASFSLPSKGIYYVGIRAVHEFGVSDINWADEQEYQDAVPLFGLRWGAPPKTPRNLR